MGYRYRKRHSSRQGSLKSILARKSELLGQRVDLERKLWTFRQAKPDFDRFTARLMGEGKSSVGRIFSTASNRNGAIVSLFKGTLNEAGRKSLDALYDRFEAEQLQLIAKWSLPERNHGRSWKTVVGGAYSEKDAFIYLDMLQYDLASEISRFETELRRLEWSLRLVLESESKLEKQSREKARVSALLNRARSSAATIKLVLARDHPCPYCGGSLGISPHADHIHPVAKGGLSTLQNMVYICVSCNSKKSHDTLTAFAAKHGKSLQEILVRLRALGKEF